MFNLAFVVISEMSGIMEVQDLWFFKTIKTFSLLHSTLCIGEYIAPKDEEINIDNTSSHFVLWMLKISYFSFNVQNKLNTYYCRLAGLQIN